MLIIHERNRVINLYYNQRNTTHEIAKIEKYQSAIFLLYKEERIKTTEVQISRAIFQRLQTPVQEKSSIELVDLLYQYYCFILTLIIPLFLYLRVIQKKMYCHIELALVVQ
jgi:hypothetical protein